MDELHHRVVGEGQPILLAHGGGEDLSMLTPLADALAASGFRVITYDRRGTGGSTRAGWPSGGVERHAADAVALLDRLFAIPATMIGFSSGGVVALAVAALHPQAVRQVIAWEPAAMAVLPSADELVDTINAPFERHLQLHPGDWVGAYHVVLDVLSEGRADHDAPVVKQSERNAEAMLRDDAHYLVRYRPNTAAMPADRITLTLTGGVNPLHREIAEILAEELGRPPVVLSGAEGHEDYLSAPERTAGLLSGLVNPHGSGPVNVGAQVAGGMRR